MTTFYNRQARTPLGTLGSTVMVLLGLAVFGIAPAFACPRAPQPELPRSNLIIESTSGSHPVSVEVARTPDQLSCGLMRRVRLAYNEGMLLHYGEPRQLYLTMADTQIPLDMLFLGADGRVVHIAPNAAPLSREYLGTADPVRAILLLRASSVERMGIKIGDRARHFAFGLGS